LKTYRATSPIGWHPWLRTGLMFCASILLACSLAWYVSWRTLTFSMLFTFNFKWIQT
jgi:hypothetical protein